MTTMVRKSQVGGMFRGFSLRRGMAWGLMIIGALIAFEIFNYSTTQYALADVLGDLRFAGMRWATILAVAFCGIDFAGIARLFTPEQGRDEPAEVWYLFGAWLLAAAMNAMLTWWGVKAAIVNNPSVSSAVIASDTLVKAVPVFVAIMVWMIRVLIIGTFSIAGERLFSQAEAHAAQQGSRAAAPLLQPASRLTSSRPAASGSFRPAARPRPAPTYGVRPEPTYHNVSMSARPAREPEYADPVRHA
jgi:hypothetical protein